MILFPRYYLFEIGDQAWCPEWMRAYIQSYLTRVWNLHIPPFSNAPPAGVAADLILGHIKDPDSFTFVDLCAGAGGPTGTLEHVLSEKLRAEGKSAARFVLTDLHPRVEEWSAISRRRRISRSLVSLWMLRNVREWHRRTGRSAESSIYVFTILMICLRRLYCGRRQSLLILLCRLPNQIDGSGENC